MEIELKQIPIRDVVNGYADSAENGAVGYGGKLNIRPAYQREFVYKEEQRNAVIRTIVHNFPLNVMYWCENSDGTYELLDGQQRTVSFCQYVNGDFSIENRFFHNLTETEKNQILDYKLMIYICKGNDKEKLDWFKTINIGSEELTKQELRNAIYTGQWLTDAKRYFSKNGCAAYKIGNKLLSGSLIRQEYLQTAIEWKAFSEDKNKTIEAYMAEHQKDDNASPLWLYFQSVINWVNTIFTVYRPKMKGLNWGKLYHLYHNNNYNPTEMEKRTKELMIDDDVTSKSGIYEYLLSGDEKTLNIRKFSESMKQAAYERQNGICAECGKHFDITEMEGDHIDPWHSGGKTNSENCQMLCRQCNRRKSGK